MTEKYFHQVKRNYDRLSGFYDLLSGRAESAILKRAKHLMKSGNLENVLDIGCGTGKESVELRRNDAGAKLFVGVDLSFKMCRKAFQRNLVVLNSNALDLPFMPSTFDVVLFSFSIEITPEEVISIVLNESYRVLKSGGVVCVVCMADLPNKNLISRLYSWSHMKFPKFVDCRPISIFQFLNENQFMIIQKENQGLYGLPVDIVVAEKK